MQDREAECGACPTSNVKSEAGTASVRRSASVWTRELRVRAWGDVGRRFRVRQAVAGATFLLGNGQTGIIDPLRLPVGERTHRSPATHHQQGGQQEKSAHFVFSLPLGSAERTARPLSLLSTMSLL